MPDISQTQLQYLLEGVKNDNPIPPTSVELEDMKFLYIRELDDGRNVHLFSRFLRDYQQNGDSELNRELLSQRRLLLMQSANKVTMVALFRPSNTTGRLDITGLNRINVIIQCLKKCFWQAYMVTQAQALPKPIQLLTELIKNKIVLFVLDEFLKLNDLILISLRGFNITIKYHCYFMYYLY